jgi:GNAT superfamily N-acetyltransferase
MTVQRPNTPLRDTAEVTAVSASASDAADVLAMLARCSRASLFHRFHGYTDGVAYFGALLRGQSLDRTILAWHGLSCVGAASLGVSATGMLELAVLVEDRWQRRGIGTLLAEFLVERARARGVTKVHADVLTEDRHVLKVLRRIGPLAVSSQRGISSIDLDLRHRAAMPTHFADTHTTMKGTSR